MHARRRTRALATAWLSALALAACAERVRAPGLTGDDGGGAPGRVERDVIAFGAPDDAPARFGGADDAARAPRVVYPPDRLLVPPNLDELELHFVPAPGTDLFEVRFVGARADLRFYTPCNPIAGGCGFVPDEASWRALTEAARGDELTITLRATRAAGGTGVGRSAERTLAFADEPMRGGLYYWAAVPGGIYRYDFGRRGQHAESFYTPAQAGGARCVGCHALSRNGARMAAGLDAPSPAPTLRLLDVATRSRLFDQGGGTGEPGSNYQALTADGRLVITTEKAGLTVRDAGDGRLIGTNPELADANMPDVAPDGTSVVFARPGAPCPPGGCATLSVLAASLFTAAFNGASFGAPVRLVTGGGNNYYPSFSPDGGLVVFNRAAGDSYDAADARVLAVPVAGGQPVDLASANADPSGAGNSWPRWAPFIHHFRGRTIQWISFSSRRPYGLRNAGHVAGCHLPGARCAHAQLWLVPVDAERIAAGEDSGYPPFWLPFQDRETGNHVAQWVETIARRPCVPGNDTGCDVGEVCDRGSCAPNVQ